MKYRYIAAFVLLNSVSSVPAFAKGEVALEVDPFTFAFGGYSLHLRISPESKPKLRYGIGTYSMELPDAFVDITPSSFAWRSRAYGIVRPPMLDIRVWTRRHTPHSDSCG